MSCYKLNLLKCNISEVEHSPLREGRKLRSWSGITHTQPNSSQLTALPPWPSCMCGTTQPVQISNAAANLTSKVGLQVQFLQKGKTSLNKVLQSTCVSTFNFCCSYGVWSWDGHLMDIPFYSGPISVPDKEINPPVGYRTVALLQFLRIAMGWGGIATPWREQKAPKAVPK